MTPVRVLLVDDNPGYLEAAARLLAADPAVHVLGEAGTGEEALAMLNRTQPDVVLMDLSLPGMSGLEATRRIKARPGAPKVVIVTLHDEPEYRAAALGAGADEFVGKADLRSHLWRAIQHATAPLHVR